MIDRPLQAITVALIGFAVFPVVALSLAMVATGRGPVALGIVIGYVAGKPLGAALLQNRGRAVHAAGTLSIDRWNGEERVQLRLTDVATNEPGGA